MCGFSAAHIREPEARNRDLILEPAEPRSCDRVITDRLGIENDTVMVVCTIPTTEQHAQHVNLLEDHS